MPTSNQEASLRGHEWEVRRGVKNVKGVNSPRKSIERSMGMNMAKLVGIINDFKVLSLNYGRKSSVVSFLSH